MSEGHDSNMTVGNRVYHSMVHRSGHKEAKVTVVLTPQGNLPMVYKSEDQHNQVANNRSVQVHSRHHCTTQTIGYAEGNITRVHVIV